MSKKHIFLSIFSKIAIFACVFCTLSAWSDTTTCDIDFTPVTGNSWQNGTPNPTSPVEIESVGTKVGNKYQISVTAQSKNLYNKTQPNIFYGYVKSDGTLLEFQTNAMIYIPIEQGKTYTISGPKKYSSTSTRVVTTAIPPASGVSTITNATFYNNQTYTITPTATEKYLSLFVCGDSDYSAYGSVEAAIRANTDVMQIEEGSTATSYTPYSAPITTTVYLDEPLRKVGDYADVLDYKTGTITRNVGVKVLDGTESWFVSGYYLTSMYNLIVDDLFAEVISVTTNRKSPYCTHFNRSTNWIAIEDRSNMIQTITYQQNKALGIGYGTVTVANIPTFKAWLAEQYANGTPVIVYYPLATPVVEQIENWSCIPPITDIQIATTKMVDDEFAQAEANLAATVQTIESVVSRTIAQTGQIATLQETKQTRPDESCPANMKCLLVQDEDGTPHWYPIIEP